MSINITKQGIVNANIFVEEGQYGKAGFISKTINNNLLSGIAEYYTNKNGTISSKNTLGSISGEIVQSLAGKTLCFSYEVCTLGDRYSTEQGQTAWNQVRYGSHGSCTISGSVNYPFANNLQYSGNATKIYSTWTIPTGGTSYGALTFAIQNYDKPASTNSNIWFMKNFKLEVSNYPTPYVMNDINVSGDSLSFNNFIEL